MATVWGLFMTVPDTYDVGDHQELAEVFADQSEAERVRDLLIGKLCHHWSVRTRWQPGDLDITLLTVR